jgi:hypothetical protein
MNISNSKIYLWPRGAGKWRQLFAALALCVLMTGFTPRPAPAGSWVLPYDMMPFTNPWCGCSSLPYGQPWTGMGGCCIAAGTVFTTVIAGYPPWWKDNLEQSYYLSTGIPSTVESIYDLFTNEKSDKAALPRIARAFQNVISMEGFLIAQGLDGQNLQTALVTLQRQTVKTYRDTAISTQVCRFGSLSYGLAKSQDVSTATQQNLATRSLHRQMLRTEMAPAKTAVAGSKSTFGTNADKSARLDQFKTAFCDVNDNNNALKELACGGIQDYKVNRDLDYTRTIDEPLTLLTNFHRPGSGPGYDDDNIMALQNNLYGHELMINMGPSDINAIKVSNSFEALKKFYAYRGVAAKRNVAANSFAAIAGLKANGSAGTPNDPNDKTKQNSYIFQREIMKELGLPSTDPNDHAKKFLGEGLIAKKDAYSDVPSYYAQMEVLTKKQFQSPTFYDNLMDSPANNLRKQSAIKALALTQDRDIYESLRRSEMLMSALVELHVQREQDRMTDKGKR